MMRLCITEEKVKEIAKVRTKQEDPDEVYREIHLLRMKNQESTIENEIRALQPLQDLWMGSEAEDFYGRETVYSA